MAKLSAHGHEVYRLEKRVTLVNQDRLATEERRIVSIRSDFAVLKRIVTKFKPDWLHPEGEWHDYGWKKRLGGPLARSKRLHT